MPFRRRGFALAFALLVAHAGAFAQLPNDDPSFMHAGLDGLEFLVTRVDPDGTILLGPSETFPREFQDALGAFFAEGLYVLVTNVSKPAGERRVLRVQVTDVAAGLVFTLKTGPQAAARVRIKESASLVRPVPATTARLRALPDEIPLPAEPADANPADARESAARARSINNLKQIGLAIFNFSATSNQFPPAVIHGPDGKPWHSWRVLILPYLDSVDVYNAYDFSQPWDSPKNKALIDKMPAVYRDPIHGDTKEPYTHYAALVGPGAIFRPDGARQTNPKKPPFGEGGVEIRSVTDGISNTAMISSVEPGRKIPWTKPEDINVGPAFKGFGQPGGIAAPYTFHGRGRGKAAPLVFGDGSVWMIGASVNPRTLQTLMTCAGDEVIPAYPHEYAPPVSQGKTLKIRQSGGKATAVIE